MEILSIRTPILKPGDDLSAILYRGGVTAGDIVVVSSKAVATVEGAMIDVQAITPGAEAIALGSRMKRTPQFCEAMLTETKRMNGKIIAVVPGAALTELVPEGFVTGSILVASAGLDESNVAAGYAIGWPHDPVASVVKLKMKIEEQTKGPVGVILSDSICMPRRMGVAAFALAVSGLDPLQSKAKKDLFGKPLLITTEAVADQLATAANFVMGNGGQSIPAAIIRDHGLELTDWEGWVPGIEKERDLFGGL